MCSLLQRLRRWWRWVWFLSAIGLARATAETNTVWNLSLSNYLSLVLASNERIQIQELQTEAARRQVRAERGIFEPALVLNAEHFANNHQLTSERSVEVGAIATVVTNFLEDNNLYGSALEFLIPTGTKFRVGANLRDLQNNFQSFAPTHFTNGEYETFVGASLTQPLLKNFGTVATLANLRAATKQSEVAWQEYRRQMGQIMAGAETAYWALYLAQEQVRFFEDSVGVAQTVLDDARARANAGRGAEIDVLQAEADLALRRNGRSDARQKLAEARSRVAAFFATTELDPRGALAPEPPPGGIERDLGFVGHWQTTFDNNPDFRAQRARVEQEGIRLAYAKNQRLPQLDLKASYGLNGLGRTPSDSWDQLTTSDFETWNVGVELRIPLGGGVRERNELAGARLRRQAALISLHEMETQLANALTTALHKVRHSRGAIDDYGASVKLNENLLENELARLKVGRVEARKVLEVERDLLQSKLSQLAAVVSHQQSVLELDVLDGTFLTRRSIERTRAEVTARAAAVMNRTLSEPRFSETGPGPKLQP